MNRSNDEIEMNRRYQFKKIMASNEVPGAEMYISPYPITLTDICKESHQRARRKGFYDPPPTVDQRIALLHSELSEAYEEYRAGKDMIYYKDGKPEGFAIEIADVAIRLFDLCEYLGIDLENVVRIKSDYNETRPLRHGKKF